MTKALRWQWAMALGEPSRWRQWRAEAFLLVRTLPWGPARLLPPSLPGGCYRRAEADYQRAYRQQAHG